MVLRPCAIFLGSIAGRFLLNRVLFMIPCDIILQLVLVVDDEDRENEGDLIMAAEKATPEAMAFIVKYGPGIICVSMKEDDLDRLQIPLMVNQENKEILRTAFTITVVCSSLSR